MTIFNPRRVAIAAVAVAWIGTITINSYTDGLELPPLGAFPADIGVSGNAISRMPDPMGDTPILVYPAHTIIRNFFGSMTRKLSVTSSQYVCQFLGTSLRRKFSIAMLKSLNVA
jgi:hypothetical protein